MVSTLKSSKEGQHVHVYVRIRPFNQQEIASNARRCVQVSGKDIIVLQTHGSKKYAFDGVFDERSTQAEVYMATVESLIPEIIQGYNCTLFSYGQTGSGKTYTMIGDENVLDNESHYQEKSRNGVIPRVLQHLFDHLTTNHLNCSIRVSYLELYNEVLFDLLSNVEQPLRLYDDVRCKGNVHIQGLEEVNIFNKEQVYEVLKKGNERKVTAATFLNANSSRSHTVFIITLHNRETSPSGEDVVKTGKLYLVDLAGSENIGRSGAVEKRAREAANINQSLLTLGRVIKALVEKSGHVPYRESKLTRILQDSLGGKTKTSIIATLSPASINVEETLSTLEYAYRAKNITNSPETNQKISKPAELDYYFKQVEMLKKNLDEVQKANQVYVDANNYENLMKESETNKQKLLEAVQTLAGLQNKTVELEQIKTNLIDVHKVTKAELESTTESLEKSKHNIKQLLEDRKIRADLIEKYDQAQTDLKEDRKILSDALDQYFIDHNKLHDKLSQMYDMSDKNAAGIEEMGEICKQHYDEIIDKTNKIMEEQTNYYQNFMAHNYDEFIDNNNSIKMMYDKILSTEMEAETHVSTVTNKLSETNESDMRALLAEDEIQNKNKNEFIKMLENDGYSDKFCAFLGTLLEMNNRHEEEFGKKQNQLVNSIKKIENVHNGHKEASKKLTNEIETAIAPLDKKFESVTSLVDSTYKRRASTYEEILKSIDNVIQSADTESTRINECVFEPTMKKLQATEQLLDKNKENCACMIKKARDNIKQVFVKRSDYCKVKHITRSAKLKTFIAMQNEFHETLDSMIERCENFLKTANVVSSNTQREAERCTQRVTLLEGVERKVRKKSNSIENAIKNCNADALASIESYTAKLVHDTEEANDRLSHFLAETLQIEEEVLKETDGSLKLVSDFADTYVGVDCSGNTPAKKDRPTETEAPELASKSILENIEELEINLSDLDDNEVECVEVDCSGNTPAKKDRPTETEAPELASKSILENIEGLEINLSDLDDNEVECVEVDCSGNTPAKKDRPTETEAPELAFKSILENIEELKINLSDLDDNEVEYVEVDCSGNTPANDCSGNTPAKKDRPTDTEAPELAFKSILENIEELEIINVSDLDDDDVE